MQAIATNLDAKYAPSQIQVRDSHTCTNCRNQMVSAVDVQAVLPQLPKSDQVWLRQPVAPVAILSPLHVKARKDALIHGFASLGALSLVGGVLSGWTVALAYYAAASFTAGFVAYRSFTKTRTLAESADQRATHAYDVREASYRQRIEIYNRLSFCLACREVTDHESQSTVAFDQIQELLSGAIADEKESVQPSRLAS